MAGIIRVYVTAWAYDGGGGFDWYYTADAADQAFAAESQNVMELQRERWTVYRFNFDASAPSPTAITREINGQLIELCAQADRSIGPLRNVCLTR